MDIDSARKRNIAVIGAGYWGKNLVRNFYEIGSLHSICDADRVTLRTFKEQCPDAKVTDNYKGLFNDPDITGVVISLPAELHYAVAKDALAAGKNVFVEKPLALDLNHAEELATLAEKKELILMVGHLMQYHPVFAKLKELVHDNYLGQIYYIYSNRLSLGKIRREENILWSFAPHDISMILSLCQEEPSWVFATGGNYLQHEIADVTVTHLSFSSGVKSHILVSWLHPFKEQKLVVVGQSRMAVFSDTENWQNKLLVFSHSITWENGIPNSRKAKPQQIKVEKSEPLRNECLHFLDCIENKRTPITDGREGIRVLKVLQEAQKHL